MNTNKNTWPKYDIYPCDLDCYGECPMPIQDCKSCHGWTQAEVDVEAALEESLEEMSD